MNRICFFLVLALVPALLLSCETILGEQGPEDELLAPPPNALYPYDILIRGTPQNLSVVGGYYVWKNGNVFSLRIAKPSGSPIAIPTPVFAGSIQVFRGMVKWVRQQNLTIPDDTRYTMGAVDYRIELKQTVSGFDFEIQPMGVEYCVLFDLRYNGASMPGIVHLGRSLQVPEALPLKICFH